MRKEIYFDIDDTLFSKKLFSGLFHEQISIETGQSIEKVMEFQKMYLSSLESTTDFHPDGLMKFISDATGTSYEDLKKILDNPEIFRKALFSETINILEELKKDYRIGIYSQGFEDFQMRKLTLSGIVDYFDKDLMIIERRKLSDDSIKKIKPGSTVIEDKKVVIEKLINHNDFRTIWVNRNKHEPIEGMETVADLIEMKSLLNK